MTPGHTDRFEYDVALSFASADRASADSLAGLLSAKGIRVVYDELAATLSPDELVLHLAELYRTRAHFCVMLFSRHYPLQRWTEAERTTAQEHALRDANEYILPVYLEGLDVPSTMETRDVTGPQHHSLESLVQLLIQKLNQEVTRSSPPPESHDLRSGNIPPKQ